MPNPIKHAKQLDLKNGYTLWCDGIAKEKYNLSVLFKILEDNESPSPGWTKSSGHWMFDVKMDFKRKSRWVNYGYRTPVYLEAPTSKKHFIICDADLHGIDHAGKRFMVVRALYGGKISGIYF